MDAIEKAEVVEAELDAFINRRARQNRAEREREEMYEASVRRDWERCRRENAQAWRSFHAHMQALHIGLAEEHAEKAQALGEGGDAVA